jgi:hypothetical protein
MAAGGYAGGLLYDLFASYALAFVLAGVAGGLNLIALLALARLRRGIAGIEVRASTVRSYATHDTRHSTAQSGVA